MKRTIKFFGMLYLDEKESSSVNFKAGSFRSKIDVYLRNAITLARSLEKSGIPFCLITNRKSYLDDVLKDHGAEALITTQEISFRTEVPPGVRFYSAHFKLDVFSYFATLPEDHYVGLLDIDMVALGRMPEVLESIVAQGTPLYYDISDQVTARHGYKRILVDMQTLSSDVFEGRWSGGELITGTPQFFAALTSEIAPVFARYREVAKELHHQGDEMITSVALERLRRSGKFYISDAGSLGIIGRFWSTVVLHEQRRFKHFHNHFLLHLPSDKRFLANLPANKLDDRKRLIDCYSAYLKKIWWLNLARKCRNRFRAAS